MTMTPALQVALRRSRISCHSVAQMVMGGMLIPHAPHAIQRAAMESHSLEAVRVSCAQPCLILPLVHQACASALVDTLAQCVVTVILRAVTYPHLGALAVLLATRAPRALNASLVITSMSMMAPAVALGTLATCAENAMQDTTCSMGCVMFALLDLRRC